MAINIDPLKILDCDIIFGQNINSGKEIQVFRPKNEGTYTTISNIDPDSNDLIDLIATIRGLKKYVTYRGGLGKTYTLSPVTYRCEPKTFDNCRRDGLPGFGYPSEAIKDHTKVEIIGGDGEKVEIVIIEGEATGATGMVRPSQLHAVS